MRSAIQEDERQQQRGSRSSPSACTGGLPYILWWTQGAEDYFGSTDNTGSIPRFHFTLPMFNVSRGSLK